MKKSLDWTIMEEFVGRLTDLWENENWQKVNHHDHTTAKKKEVAEAISKKDLLSRLAKDLNSDKFKNTPVDPNKSFTRGDHWKGAKPGDYGYTGYQGHGMPTDKAERDRIRADKKKGVAEDWNKVNHHDKTNGLSQKAVNAYRRENPGSKLKTAVTTKPSKLKAGSKDAKRRKSFCARMSGNEGPMKKPNGEPTPKALALRRWNCE
jgi:hypothetical protein